MSGSSVMATHGRLSNISLVLRVLGIALLTSIDVQATEENEFVGNCSFLVPSSWLNVNETIAHDISTISTANTTNLTSITVEATLVCRRIEANGDTVIGIVGDCGLGLMNRTDKSNDTTSSTDEGRLSEASDIVTPSTEIHMRTTYGPMGDVSSSILTTISQDRDETEGNSNNDIRNAPQIGPSIIYMSLNDFCQELHEYDSGMHLPPRWYDWSMDQTEVMRIINLMYSRILIPVVGIPGNILAFLTIVNMKPLLSSSLYIAVLAVSDTLFITNLMFFNEKSRMYNPYFGKVECKLINWNNTWLPMFSNMILVLMTVERVVAVWYPLKVKAVCTKKKAVVSMAIACVASMGLNSFVILGTTSDVLPYPVRTPGTYCMDDLDYIQFLDDIGVWLNTIFSQIIPAVILTICNWAIIAGMRRRREVWANNKLGDRALEEVRKEQQQITVRVLTVSFVFIMLTTPAVIFQTFEKYFFPTLSPDDMETIEKLALVRTVINKLTDINQAVNFIMYFLAGQKFRSHLFTMSLRCIRKIFRRHRE